MNSLLLDTHVWIWLSLESDAVMSTTAMKAVNAAEHRWISAISCWELAKLVEKGRIGFSIPTLTWIHRSLQEVGIGVAELTPEIAVESTQLNLHADPADQIIAATARIMGVPLVTSDKRLRESKQVETVW